MAPSKCPVYINGKVCGLKLVEMNAGNPRFSKVYVCERGHQPYCIPWDSRSWLEQNNFYQPGHAIVAKK